MTNIRLSLMTVLVAGVSLVTQPAFSSDIDDMLKKYPNPEPGTYQPSAVSGKESRMLNALNQHVQKMYSQISSAATAGKLTADEAAIENKKVQDVERSLQELERSTKYKPESNYTALSTLFTYSDQLSYGDMQQLVSMIGTAEADLNDLLSKKQKKASEVAAKTPPAKPLPKPQPGKARYYRNSNPASNAVY